MPWLSHIRNVPGRKTDVNDATWIADLLAHGLIRGNFVPPPEIQELRDLTRTRKQLVRAACRMWYPLALPTVSAGPRHRRRKPYGVIEVPN
jgi:hypothetical protein